MIYLDNAATTFPKPEKVYAVMDETNRKLGVNAGRGSYRLAREASELIGNTKKAVRELVGANDEVSVVFSPSVTVAMNQIINGIEWIDDSTVYLSPYEHNAVARTIHSALKKNNIKIKLLPISDDSLEIDMEKIRYEFAKEKPFAVFCTHISNVTGYILPVEEIFDEAKRYNSITVLDSAQSMGLLPIDIRKIKADFIAFAGHKSLYGPFGIGGFINVSGSPLNEVLTGGTGSDSLNLNMPSDGESRYEASSPNIVAIAGLNAALDVLDVTKCYEHEKSITEYLIKKMSGIKYVHMFLPNNREKHIGILSFVFDGLASDELGTILDADFDIAVRTGYHCAPYIHEYLKDQKTLGTVRIGISQFTTKEDIDSLVTALYEICED